MNMQQAACPQTRKCDGGALAQRAAAALAARCEGALRANKSLLAGLVRASA